MRQKSDLRDAQQRVATALYEHNAVMAIVPMGGGKTASGLTAVRELLDDGVIEGALVLAPKLVCAEVWAKEHLLWAHLAGLRIVPVVGGPVARAKALRQDADIWVVGLENIKWLLADLADNFSETHPIFDLMLVDEISRFKDPYGKTVSALLKFCRNQPTAWPIRWGLTGTPRPNGYIDMFKPLSLLTKEKLWGKTFDRWRKLFFIQDYNGHTWEVHPFLEGQLRKQAARHAITISDDDMPDMPPCTDVFHWVELPPAALKTYKDMERTLLARISEDDAVLAANSAVASGKLSQIANGFLYDEEGVDTFPLHTAKIDKMRDLSLAADGEPLLVAYEFREDLASLKDIWPDLKWLGAGRSDRQTSEAVTAWNAGMLLQMALHPAAAGHGLNLQFGGSQFVWYGMPWSAELYAQALHRIVRPGQTKHCFNHHIFARNTVDEAKYLRVTGKLTAEEAFRQYVRSV